MSRCYGSGRNQVLDVWAPAGRESCSKPTSPPAHQPTSRKPQAAGPQRMHIPRGPLMHTALFQDSLDGRRIVVIGAGSHIGRRLAQTASAAGAELVLAGPDADRLKATAATLAGPALVQPADLTDAVSYTHPGQRAGDRPRPRRRPAGVRRQGVRPAAAGQAPGGADERGRLAHLLLRGRGVAARPRTGGHGHHERRAGIPRRGARRRAGPAAGQRRLPRHRRLRRLGPARPGQGGLPARRGRPQPRPQDGHP